jgi:VWFA-related protein
MSPNRNSSKKSRWATRSVVVVALTISAATYAAFPRPTAPQQPIRATARIVQIDVLVHDRDGKSVPDLTKDDFTILDDKHPQQIQFFSVVKTEILPAAADPLPPGTFSNELDQRGVPANLTVVLLDALNTSFADQAFSRSQLAKLLLTLQPQDRVALYVLGARLRILHDFTSDASSLLAALKQFKDDSLLDPRPSPSPSTNLYNLQLVPLAEELNAGEKQLSLQEHAHLTADALRLIADHVVSLPGRKNLVWVSGSFPFSLDTTNVQRGPSGEKLPFATDAELAVRALTSANIAIYPVDARGLITGGFSGDNSHLAEKPDPAQFAAMHALAARTGGRSYYNTNAIMGSIRQAIDESRVAYSIGFSPDPVRWDGTFHKIQVKVNRSNVQVTAREGYFALSDPNLTDDARIDLMAQAARSTLEPTGIRFRAQASPAGRAGDRALTVFLQLDARQLDLEQKDGQWQDVVDLAYVQVDAQNRILQTVRVPLPLALDDETYGQLMKEPLPIPRDIPIQPNAAVLRVIVFDEGNSKLGSVHIPLANFRTASPNKSN